MEDITLDALRNRIDEYFRTESLSDAIAHVEEELDDIIEKIFEESDVDKDSVMEGNAEILYSTKGGYMILKDDGSRCFMYETAYKGSITEPKTRILCGMFRKGKSGVVCVDAQECLCMNELKYSMYSYIEEGDMVRASSAAWALYKDASVSNQEKMKICIHKLRNILKNRNK